MNASIAEPRFKSGSSPAQGLGLLDHVTRAGLGPVHYFTVDVEEHFHVTALEGVLGRQNGGALESRVVANVERLLGLMSRARVKGTFFVLGLVARQHPGLVRRIHQAGHEIASHGWNHQRVTRQQPEEFRRSVRQSKEFLEDITGEQVLGFRAPSFSITPGREWALDILLEEGYRYDSSLFPVLRPGYGYRNGARDPHWLIRPSGRLREVPPATLRWIGINLPAAGGAYFRLFPYAWIKSALLESERRAVPGTFYIHPWELDPAQPRFEVSWPTRIRHYGGLERTADRLKRLLSEFRFGPIAYSFSAR